MKTLHENTAVLILAGGQSQRAETIKGLRQFNDKYWIDVQIDYFKSHGIKSIFVGLGYDHLLYIKRSKNLKRCFYTINSNPHHGSFSTLQNTLIKALEQEWNRIVIIHIDHALPKPSTLTELLAHHDYAVIKPTNDNVSGHPIVLSRDFCKILINQSFSSQLNTQIRKLNVSQILWVKVNDKNIHENFNTKEKWDTYNNNSK